MEREATAFEQAMMAFDMNNLRMAIRFMLKDRQDLIKRIEALETINPSLKVIPGDYDGVQEISFVKGLDGPDSNLLNPDNYLPNLATPRDRSLPSLKIRDETDIF